MPTSKHSIADELRADPRFAHVLEVITEADAPDEPVYLVGGAVRDALLGHPSYDLDLVVEGDVSSFARRLAGQLDGRCQTHDGFGTAEVFYEGGEIDVATARTETYRAPAALPDVTFATLEEDLARRDFTINAIAASLGAEDFGRVIDPHHGREDLAARTIRVLHERSFLDDPTRILRAVRYENRLGFRMDEQTERLARAAVEGLDLLSGARKREELVALLDEDDIEHTLERLADLDIGVGLDYTEAVPLVERLDALRAELDPEAPAWRVRLEVLAHRRSPTDLRAFLDRLDLPRQTMKAIERAISAAPRLAEATDPVEIADLAASAPDAPLLALTLAESPGLRNWFARLRNVRLEVTGADLAELGLAESPRVGEVLAELRRRKLRGELDGRDSELAAARELIHE